ncbi:MAG: hypothetical protein RQ833_06555 [Sphingomonadaceae bacterium]|nr:hypothetical protein [Sphingomonadaceae bacterium]
MRLPAWIKRIDFAYVALFVAFFVVGRGLLDHLAADWASPWRSGLAAGLASACAGALVKTRLLRRPERLRA